MLPSSQKEFEKDDIYEELQKKEQNTDFSRMSTAEAEAIKAEYKDKRLLVSFMFVSLVGLFVRSYLVLVFVSFMFFVCGRWLYDMYDMYI